MDQLSTPANSSQTACSGRLPQCGRIKMLLANASTAVAYEVGVSPSSVVAWRSRFAEEGLAKLDRVRSGRGG